MRKGFICIFTALAACLSAGASQAFELAAHRALYELTLARAHSGSGISGVTGELVLEWRNGCTGWTFEYSSIIDVAFTGKEPVRLASTASTWESSDGKKYRFSVRHQSNGEDTDRIEGVATAAGPHKAGQVVFTKPERRKVTLPAGTLFPVAHTRAIIAVAMKGGLPAFVERPVFDGMDEEGIYRVNAAIGRARKNGSNKLPLGGKLRNVRSWPVSLAYFSLGSNKAEPEHEIKMRLYANGVADDMVLDFDDFAMNARIGRLELLKEPGCH